MEQLKADGGTMVWRGRLPVGEVVLKRWRLSTVGARLKALVGKSRAHRHWDGAAWLVSRGILTARPRAILRGPGELWLVMDALPGRTLLHEMADCRATCRREHAIARALARQLVSMTLAGRYNRDHKPSNLIVGSDESKIGIIDTVAIRPLRPWRKADLYAMFASLVIEPLGCGCLPRRSLMMRVLVEHQRELLRLVPDVLPGDPAVRRAARHGDWMRVAGMVAEHGDPTPRVDPLANYTPPAS